MAASFEAVREKMRQSAPAGDRSDWIRSLDARQRKVLPLFDEWAHLANTPRRAIDRPVQTKAASAPPHSKGQAAAEAFSSLA
jgi:hypothetical protein